MNECSGRKEKRKGKRRKETKRNETMGREEKRSERTREHSMVEE